jgi:hypothetical protein
LGKIREGERGFNLRNSGEFHYAAPTLLSL